MRDLVARHVPEDLVDRPKAGFTPPWERWFSAWDSDGVRQGGEVSDEMLKPDVGDLGSGTALSPVIRWNLFSYFLSSPLGHASDHHNPNPNPNRNRDFPDAHLSIPI